MLLFKGKAIAVVGQTPEKVPLKTLNKNIGNKGLKISINRNQSYAQKRRVTGL